mgnify:CR=1 FL=1
MKILTDWALIWRKKWNDDSFMIIKFELNEDNCMNLPICWTFCKFDNWLLVYFSKIDEKVNHWFVHRAGFVRWNCILVGHSTRNWIQWHKIECFAKKFAKLNRILPEIYQMSTFWIQIVQILNFKKCHYLRDMDKRVSQKVREGWPNLSNLSIFLNVCIQKVSIW